MKHLFRHLLVLIALLAMNDVVAAQSMFVAIGSDSGPDLGMVRTGATIRIICSPCIAGGKYYETYHGLVSGGTSGPDKSALSIDQVGVFMKYCSGLTPLPGYDTIRASFRPTKAGNYSGGISVDSVQGSQPENITGGGFSFVAKVVDTFPGGYLSVAPSPLKFDTLIVGNRKTLDFVVVNTYLSSDTVTISVKVDSLKYFKFEEKLLTAILKPGDRTTYSIDFSPQSVGFFTDTILISSNATQTADPIRIPVSGVGVKPTSSILAREVITELSINGYQNSRLILLSSNLSKPENPTIELFDALGRRQSLSNSQLFIPSGSSTEKVDVGNLASGCYILRIKLKDETISKSFVYLR